MALSELPPDPARVIEGLRDTGYSFTSAIADIVDNSIEAEAQKIAVQLSLDVLGDVVVTITDDGYGMTSTELRQAMQYGSPRNKTRRLSKFGLGLKTASTAFCRRLEVTSRSADLEASTAVWDLDTIVDAGKWLLEELEGAKQDVARLELLAPGQSGTVVRWAKIDRLLTGRAAAGRHKSVQSAMDRHTSSLHEHLGMVFQRYLQEWEGRPPIEMTVNGQQVKPWDPFCVSETRTLRVTDTTKKAELPDGSEATFRVRSYVIPSRSAFDSPGGATIAKLSSDLQGIYIYREDRLIHGPDWLRIVRQEPHYTLARVEFSFTQDLDDAFNVDIKKSRIELSDNIYDFIKEKVVPPVRKIADEVYRGEKAKIAAGRTVDLHDGANNVLSARGLDLQGIKVEEVNNATGTATIKNPRGTVTIDISSDPVPNEGLWVRALDSIVDGLLWNPTFIGDHVAVELNTSHPFYERVYVPAMNENFVQAVDYLLWAVSSAELYVTSTTHQKAFKELRYETSKRLRDLAEALPAVEILEE